MTFLVNCVLKGIQLVTQINMGFFKLSNSDPYCIKQDLTYLVTVVEGYVMYVMVLQRKRRRDKTQTLCSEH